MALFMLSVAKQERGFAPNPTKGRGPLETILYKIGSRDLRSLAGSGSARPVLHATEQSINI
jgi:hypothetical protein